MVSPLGREALAPEHRHLRGGGCVVDARCSGHDEEMVRSRLRGSDRIAGPNSHHGLILREPITGDRR